MKFKLIATAAMVLGLASAAQADQKVAEYGDPVLGNSYGGCTFTQIYGTGGGGYLYNEYQIACTSGTYIVGVYSNFSSWTGTTCTFYSRSTAYRAEGSCSNWRVYLKS
jgi:hypothetical protein